MNHKFILITTLGVVTTFEIQAYGTMESKLNLEQFSLDKDTGLEQEKIEGSSLKKLLGVPMPICLRNTSQ